MSKHLWEVEHPYYCNEGNYHATREQPFQEYVTWTDFMDEEADSDFDMNLVFRVDWFEGGEEDDPEDRHEFSPLLYKGDDTERNGILKLFIMGQRKGLYRWVVIKVCRADEDAVRAYLTPRWEHLKRIWEPLS